MERTSARDTVLTAVPDPDAPDQRVRTAIALGDLRNSVVCNALETWQNLRGVRCMPAREDMTPRAMLKFLRNVCIIEALDGGKDFRFRIAGDAVNLQQGMPLQGLTTADLDARVPGYGLQLRRAYQRVLRHGEPFAYRGLYFRPGDAHTFSHEAIMAPLGTNGETADHVMVVAA